MARERQTGDYINREGTFLLETPGGWEGPVGIDLHFGLPKPKSAPKKRRVWPDKRPDLDKLTRAVLDALTYVVYADDSQVVEIRATKDYGAPGVAVEIHRIAELDASSA